MIRYKILFAEDIPDDMELAEMELRKAGIQFESVRTETKIDFLNALRSFKPDVVISDYAMPTFNGMEALELVLKYAPFTPVIIHTGSINEETAVKCMKAGAYDYVLKEKIMRLPYALREAHDRSIILKENKLAQTALMISEEKYKGLFNSIAQGVFYVQNDGAISTINSAACNILFLDTRHHYDLERLNNEWEFKTESYLPFDLRNYQNAKIQDDGYIINNKVIKAKHLSSKIEKWIQFNIIPQLYDENKSHYHSLVVIEDITERKKSEIDLILAKEKAEESDRLKTSFLANLSHEVRTPMNAILGFSELLSEIKTINEEERFYIETIQNNSSKLLNIITDIIEMSKIETEKIILNKGNFELTALKTVVNELYHTTAISKGINLILTGFEDSIVLNSDEQKLKKILTILIDNAVKFTDKGEIRVRCIIKPGLIEFQIIDTGCGVPEGHEELIFERFRQADETYSRKHGGTGLGLSIARAYTEALGGKIWYTKKEIGSQFTINIPVSWTYSKQESQILSDSENPDFSDYTVLVAEDDATNFAYLTKILALTHVNILYASNGAEAVELLTENHEVNLVLMDIRMPVMDGYEATETIRKFNTEIPIIATTAYAMSGDKEKCIQAGCNAYVSKPIRKSELFTVIGKFLS